jgi:hypothetical protein
MVSAEVHAQLKRVLKHAARECLELLERDRAPLTQRIGGAFVLALRPWAYSALKPYER